MSTENWSPEKIKFIKKLFMEKHQELMRKRAAVEKDLKYLKEEYEKIFHSDKNSLKGREITEEVVKILKKMGRPSTIDRLWDAFLEKGFNCEGEIPKATFSASFVNDKRRANGLLVQVGINPNKYYIREALRDKFGIPDGPIAR